MLTFDNWQTTNGRRSKIAFPECNWWGPSEWALAMVGEAGEVADAVKKLNRKGPINSQMLTDAEKMEVMLEIGDTLSYLAQTASSLDVSLEACAYAAYNKVNARKGYTEELTDA